MTATSMTARILAAVSAVRTVTDALALSTQHNGPPTQRQGPATQPATCVVLVHGITLTPDPDHDAALPSHV